LAASPDRIYDYTVAGPEVAFAVWDRFDNASYLVPANHRINLPQPGEYSALGRADCRKLTPNKNFDRRRPPALDLLNRGIQWRRDYDCVH